MERNWVTKDTKAEWIKKMWYTAAIKRNEIGSFLEMRMNLESVIQSEISQKEKNKYCIFTKKGNAKESSSYSTITLISEASKVMLKILETRLQ